MVTPEGTVSPNLQCGVPGTPAEFRMMSPESDGVPGVRIRYDVPGIPQSVALIGAVVLLVVALMLILSGKHSRRRHGLTDARTLDLGSVAWRVHARLTPLVEPIARAALRIGVGNHDRTVTRLLGGDGKVNGSRGFSRATLLICNDDRFHERQIKWFRIFTKALFWLSASRGTTKVRFLAIGIFGSNESTISGHLEIVFCRERAGGRADRHSP
jgi:hypothetical protein